MNSIFGPLSPCCCGRIKHLEPGERSRINDRVHARLGDPGAFCGPWWRHEIEDLASQRDELVELLNRIKEYTTQHGGAAMTLKEINKILSKYDN